MYYGLTDKSTHTVISTLERYQADHKFADEYGYMNLECIHADAGGEFTTDKFREYCWNSGVHLSLAAPKKQYQNHLAE
jgi:hypothetical protein